MERYISIRVVNIDHYLDDPGPMDRAFCPFSNSVLKKVPVIRIFGSTPSGQKACLHIHQSYPYFYVPFKLPSHNVEPEQIQREIFQFGNALNHAVGLAQGANQSGVNGDQYIAAITLVKGIPFYGYHSEPETYLKIHLLNPADKQRMADLLLKGVINNQIYQPHEAHIPYVLQFMMDYNLYGMNWVHLHPIIDSTKTMVQQQQQANSDNINNDDNDDDEKEKENVQLSLRFREPLFDEPKTVLLSQTTINSSERSTSIYLNENEYFTSKTIPDELKWNKVGRTSFCELELDTTVMTIGNRLDLQQRNIHWNREVDVGESKEKLINSLAGIWKDEANRRMARNESPTIPNTQQQENILRDQNPKEWSSEEAWKRLIDRYTSPINNKDNLATSPLDVEEYNGLIHSSNIPTTFESVESLYPPQYYDIHQRQKVSQSLTMPPKVLSNLSDWSQSQSSGSQQGQQQQEEHYLKVNESPYDIQAATPSRYRAWRNEGQAVNNDNVNADKIHSLVRQQSSFQDDDITDEDILALARQLSEQEQEEQKEKEEQEQLEQQEGEEYHDDDFMWPSDSPFRKTPERKRLPQAQISYDDTESPDLFRPRKLDFHAEVAKIDARQKEAAQSSSLLRVDKENNTSTTHTTIMNIDENDHDRELQVSEIPPTPPRAYKRNRYLPQYDGACDSSENDDDRTNDIHYRRDNNTQQSNVSRQRPPLPYSEEPYISAKYYPKLTELVMKKKREREDRELQSQRQQNQVVIIGQENRQRQLEKELIDQNDTLASGQKRKTDLERHDKPFTKQSRIEYGHLEKVSLTIEQQQHTIKTKPPGKEYNYSHPPPAIAKPKYVTYQEPYYSNPTDAPNRPKIFGKEFRIPSKSIQHLKPVQPVYSNKSDNEWKHSTITGWEPAIKPPTPKEVREWLREKEQRQLKEIMEKKANKINKSSNGTTSQLDGPSTLDFQFSLSKPKSKVTQTRDYLDILSVEIHINTRDNMLPDPEYDPVQTIFWCLKTEDANIVFNGFEKGYHVEIITVGTDINTQKIGLPAYETDYVENEESLFKALIEVVRLYDPDMLVGYELHNSSWGYLIERATVHDINLIDELARVGLTTDRIQFDQWGYRKASVFKILGRHMINIWRVMKSEYNLTSYTFENLAYNILHCRMSHFSHATLTSWYTQKDQAVLKYRLYKYYLDRVQMNLDLLDVSEIINRTCESARVFGVDFYSVLTRGSQFKVESMMLRIAKPENFVLISPSRAQVGRQRAAECLPLVMEPVTEFYSSPLLVLDFQSLYPSIMIAYNYCFSTCLGKVRNEDDPPKFGVTELDITPDILCGLKDKINVSPNGVMFVKSNVRKSLLAKMLTEILDTRVMIKTAMKNYKEDKGLLRLLDARQLTLKYIANVTYGYTSASFSGRMPAVEIADSIVQTGRETLERTITVINETEKWDARVVYGDTDSVFVSLPGRTREQAFQIGKDIAKTITAMNPAPVRLKFEKVYHPCVLVAKKRYVGFKYENPEETEPVFEAKGIETVRRDGTMATQKILEASLKILFRTQDMSQLKEYLYRQWTKILSNRVAVQDFIIAREVRLGTYSEQGLPNGARVALDNIAQDRRDVPQHGERVPYVVVYRGGPNAKLRDKVVRPEEILIHDPSLQLDAEYYITKMIIPPLSRIFNLVGVDVKAWYDEMPRSRKTAAIASARYQIIQNKNKSFKRIDQFYASSHCIVCRRLTDQNICSNCTSQPAQTIFTLRSRQAETEKRFVNTLLICQSCSGISPILTANVASSYINTTHPNPFSEQQQEEISNDMITIDTTGYADHPCESLDCPVFYERVKTKNDVRATSTYNELL